MTSSNVGGIGGHGTVTSSGTFAYSIPLATVMAQHSNRVSVGLDYNSGGGNGIVGVGWALTGFPALKSCRPNLSPTAEAIGATTCLGDVPVLGGRTVPDTGVKVETYAVHYPDGTVHHYGESVLVPGTGEYVRYVERVEHDRGRAVHIEYRMADECFSGSDGTHDVTPGTEPPEGFDRIAVGPRRIFVNHGGETIEELYFHYECNRSDPYYRKEFGQGNYYQVRDRLAAVVFANFEPQPGAGGVAPATLSWRTTFAYSEAGAGARSKLTTLTRCVFAEDGTPLDQIAQMPANSAVDCLPQTSIDWQLATGGWAPPIATTAFPHANACAKYVGDFSGDGVPDVMSALDCGAGNTLQIRYGLATGLSNPVGTNVDASGKPWHVVDIDNDGRTDLVRIGKAGDRLEFRYAFTPGAGGGPAAFSPATVFPAVPNAKIHELVVSDLDHDGLGDVITCEDSDQAYFDPVLQQKYGLDQEWGVYRNRGTDPGWGLVRAVATTKNDERRVRCGPGALRNSAGTVVYGEAARYLGYDILGTHILGPFQLYAIGGEPRINVALSPAHVDLFEASLYKDAVRYDLLGNGQVWEEYRDDLTVHIGSTLDTQSDPGRAYVVDHDHDGRAELLYGKKGGTWKLDGVRQPVDLGDAIWKGQALESVPGADGFSGTVADGAPLIIADFNADGRVDILRLSEHSEQAFLSLANGATYDGIPTSGHGDLVRRVVDGTGQTTEVEYGNGNVFGTSLYDADYDDVACSYPARCLAQGGSSLVKLVRRRHGTEPPRNIYYTYARRVSDLWAGRDLGFYRVKTVEVDGIIGLHRVNIVQYGNDKHTYGTWADRSTAASGYLGFPYAGKQVGSWTSVLDQTTGRTYVHHRASFWQTRSGSSEAANTIGNAFAFVGSSVSRSWDFEPGSGVDLEDPGAKANNGHPALTRYVDETRQVNAYGLPTAIWTSTEGNGKSRTVQVDVEYASKKEQSRWIDGEEHASPWLSDIDEWRWRRQRRTTTVTSPEGDLRVFVTEYEYWERLDGTMQLRKLYSDRGDPDYELVMEVDTPDVEAPCAGVFSRIKITGANIESPRVTEYEADPLCRFVTTVRQPGVTQSSTVWHTGLRQPVAIRNAFGVERRTSYDPWRRVAQFRSHGRDGVAILDGVSTSYHRVIPAAMGPWDPSPSPLRVVGQSDNGNLVETTLDWRGNVVDSEWDSVGGRVHQVNTYDGRGRRVFASIPVAAAVVPVTGTSYSYDALGRTTEVTPEPGRTWTTQFKKREQISIDPQGKKSTHRFDAFGRRVEIEDHDGTKVCFEYGPMGAITAIRRGCVDDPTADTTITPDRYGRTLTLNEPGGAGLRTYAYNALGELRSAVDGNGDRMALRRDAAGRVIERTRALALEFIPSHTSTWTFEPLTGEESPTIPPGALLASSYTHHVGLGEKAPKVTTEYGYDPVTGRVSSERTTIGAESFISSVAYDGFGRVSELRFPTFESPGAPKQPTSLRVGYQYGPHGHLLGISRIHSDVMTTPLWTLNATNAAGQHTSVAFGNGTITTTNFNPATGELTQRDSNSPAAGTFQNLMTTYWPAGSVKSRQHVLQVPDGPMYFREEMSYDNLHRLIETDELVSETPSGFTLVSTDTRTYDAWGNVETHPDLGAIESTAAGRVEQVDGQPTHSYDANGQLLGDANGTYTWWPSKRMASAESPGGARTDYYYDLDGHRVLTTSSDGGSRLTVGGYERTTDGDTAMHRYQVPGPAGVVAIVSKRTRSDKAPVPDADMVPGPSFKTFYPHTDAQGTVNFVTDENGDVQTTLYTPWGAPRAEVNGVTVFDNVHDVNLGFTGHTAKPELSMTYMRGRNYDHGINRMVSPDPFVAPWTTQGFNRYSYVRNNPATFTDPSGYWAQISQPWSAPNPCALGFNCHSPAAAPAFDMNHDLAAVSYFSDSLRARHDANPQPLQMPQYSPQRDRTPYRPREDRKWGDRIASGAVARPTGRAPQDSYASWRCPDGACHGAPAHPGPLYDEGLIEHVASRWWDRWSDHMMYGNHLRATGPGMLVSFFEGITNPDNWYLTAVDFAVINAGPGGMGLDGAIVSGRALGRSLMTTLRGGRGAAPALSTAERGVLVNLSKGSPSAPSEVRAGAEMAKRFDEVVLRDPPPGARRSPSGATADLLVDSFPVDVYTPSPFATVKTIRATVMKKLAQQAPGVAVNLENTLFKFEDLVHILKETTGPVWFILEQAVQ